MLKAALVLFDGIHDESFPSDPGQWRIIIIAA